MVLDKKSRPTSGYLTLSYDVSRDGLSLYSFCVLVLMLQICKLRVLRQPCKVYGADWTVTLLGYDDF